MRTPALRSLTPWPPLPDGRGGTRRRVLPFSLLARRLGGRMGEEGRGGEGSGGADHDSISRALADRRFPPPPVRERGPGGEASQRRPPRVRQGLLEYTAPPSGSPLRATAFSGRQVSPLPWNRGLKPPVLRCGAPPGILRFPLADLPGSRRWP